MKQAYFQLSPEKRDLILAAACAEFGAHDFDAASLDRVVAAAYKRIATSGTRISSRLLPPWTPISS